MTDFVLGGILLTVSTYIILKLLEDVLPILLNEYTDRGQTTKISRSRACTDAATPSARSRKSSAEHGTVRTNACASSVSRIRPSRTAHTRGGTGHDAA